MKTQVTLAELKRWLTSKNNLMLLDVRSKEEYLEKHIPHAEHVPLERIESGDYKPASGKVIVTVCGKGGGRSERAANYLRNIRRYEAYFLEGGTTGWFS